MMNKAFMQQSTMEKAHKLDAVLRKRTNNALESKEICDIIRHASPDFQYVIDVYSNLQDYCHALFHDNGKDQVSKVIFGNVLPNCGTGNPDLDFSVMDMDSAAAIITKGEYDGQLKNAIIIYVPESEQ